MIESSFKYYRSRLSGEKEKKIYDMILEGMKHCVPTIKIDSIYFGPKISASLGTIIQYVVDDNPGLFHVARNARVYRESNDICIEPIYYYSSEEIIRLDAYIQDRIELILESGKTANLISLYAWELFFHDFLASNVEYEKKDTSYHKVHSIIGPLLYGRAVCEGYSKTFKLLCDMMCIPCIFLTGKIDKEGYNSIGMHAWNIVKLDTYYHVDVTGDRSMLKGDAARHGLFNTTDLDIGIDHKWSDQSLPKCRSNQMNYYVMNKSFFDNLEEGKRYISKQLLQGINSFSFRLQGCTYTGADIVSMIESAADPIVNDTEGYHFCYSYDDTRKVIYIRFGVD